MSYRIWLCVVIASAAMLAGCGKKEVKKEEVAQVPELVETTPATDTGDIFDEFYDETKAKPKAKAGARDETFSTSDYGYTPQFSPDGPFVVQVSCVVSRAVAEANVSKLEAKGYPAYIAEVESPTPDLIGTYYRVRVGGFIGISRAKEFGDQALIPAGYEYWVDNRSNDNVGMSGYGMGGGSSSDYGSSYSTPSYESSSTPTSTTTSSSTSDDTWGSSSSAASEPATTGSSLSSEPAASEPAASEPAAPEPVASEPVASEPAPAPSEPAPAAEQPAASEPAPSSTESGGSDWGSGSGSGGGDDWGSDSDW